MAWQYADYSLQDNTPAQLARLKQHLVEVRQAIANPKQASNSGVSWALADLTNYLKQLTAEAEKLQVAVNFHNGSMMSRMWGGKI